MYAIRSYYARRSSQTAPVVERVGPVRRCRESGRPLWSPRALGTGLHFVTPSPPLRRTGSPLPQAGQDVETAHVLPLAFFGAGQLWFLIGALGLVVIAPDLAAGQLSSPRVFAVTHAFTLGMVASVIFGASHQFVPAVMGVPIRRWWVAILGFLTFEAGVVTLVARITSYNVCYTKLLRSSNPT